MLIRNSSFIIGLGRKSSFFPLSQLNFFKNQQQFSKMSSASSYLINQSDFGFLKQIGLTELNEGVFDGNSWKASGQIVDSICPSTNTPIARIRFGTVEVNF